MNKRRAYAQDAHIEPKINHALAATVSFQRAVSRVLLLYMRPFKGSKPRVKTIGLLLLVLTLAGCAYLTPAPQTKAPGLITVDAPRPEEILTQLDGINQKLQSFKGIGAFRITEGRSTRGARMAWIGQREEQLRVEVIGPAGQPLASLASDGEWFYLLSRNPQRFYKTRATEARLSQLIELPLTPQDAVALLVGRVPVAPHRSAALFRHPQSGEYMLELAGRWQRPVQRIYLDSTLTRIPAFEMIDRKGQVVYRADYKAHQEVQGYRLPKKLVLSNLEAMFELELERCWADVPIAPAIFTLQPPG